MLAPAATAWRIAMEPEWYQVPSPRFWKTWPRPVKREVAAQLTPSPPIWMSDEVSRSIQLAMKWQPMPARAWLPSGTLVEVLCGQPEQK